ncbi:MAG TPA: hypothetical protein VHC22_12415 [Pirellulales bacterium]|nr:hypothetical protein [Pirellulales bacterium]
MNVSAKVGLIIVAAAVCGLSAGEAKAQVGGSPYFLGYGFYGNGLYNSIDRPPFYALFPPVYYSHPVGRPYGYSPFAYPPGFTTPVIQPAPVKEVANPYVPRKPAGQTAERTAAVAREIINPYVRRPQVALAPRDQTVAD